ncbi:VOC family protein [Citricoccus sp. NPDC079358]|uniref:VOC family protein n=1 Tax=Citricoccus sp. NPDC079358 TaxID=3154653 RepID=UPI0034506D0B
MSETPQTGTPAVPTAPRATPFLMFEGQGGQAMTFYVETLAPYISGTEVTRLERRTAESPEAADNPDLVGTVYAGEFTVAGTPFRVFDSPPGHQFSFTPSISIFVELPGGGPDPQAELDAVDALAGELSSDGGHALMPADGYGFSRRFAWVADRWGVTWQLNCA